MQGVQQLITSSANSEELVQSLSDTTARSWSGVALQNTAPGFTEPRRSSHLRDPHKMVLQRSYFICCATRLKILT
jgi:hypothetical protein